MLISAIVVLLVFVGGQHPVLGQAAGSEAQVGNDNPQLDDGNGASAAGGNGGSDDSPAGCEGETAAEQESQGEETTPKAQGHDNHSRS